MNRLPGPSIWSIRLDELDDDPSLLGPVERDRAARFVRSLDRRRYIQAHCALRRIVGSILGIAPGALAFTTTEAGKPMLLPLSSFDFSLSHSADVALVATSAGRRVGIDIEIRREIDDLDGVARQIMTAREHLAFEDVPEPDRRRAFYDLWTRKEALLKAIGRGFLEDPRSFEIESDRNAGVTECCQAKWTVAQLETIDGASAAIAIENMENEHIVTGITPYLSR